MRITVAKRVFIYGWLVTFLTFYGVVRGQTYYVQPGDSLYTIAARYGTSIAALQRNNNLITTEIHPGQALSLTRRYRPQSTGSAYTVRAGDSLLKIYIVQSGDPLYLIAKRNGISVKELLEANHLGNASSILPGQRLIIPNTSSGSEGSSKKFNLSQSDLDLFARLVSAESAGEPFVGQVAVAATVLNRLEDPRYPNTIPGVIYQVDNGKYQYSPVLDGRINLPAGHSAYQAVEQALQGSDPSNGANGFYNPAKTTNQWVRSQPVTATIGEHVFFRY